MAIFKNTTISGTGYITPPKGTSSQRPVATTTVVQWTTSGYTVIAGNTPTATTTSWTCPVGVTSVEVLVVGGGGGGGNCQNNGGTPGGGGGAGGLVYRSNWAVSPGTIYAIEVGAGGAAQTTANKLGNSGSNSIFGTRTNLISNPQFAAGISGWTSYNSTLAHFNGNSLRATATAGNPSGATTTFTTVVGRRYYYKAEVSQSGAITNDARIQISGIGLVTPTGQSLVSTTTTIFDSFTATSTSHILELLLYNSQAGATITVDNVEVYDITDANIVAYGGGGGGSDDPTGPFGSGDPARRRALSGGSGGGGSNNYPVVAVGAANQGNSGGSGNLASGGGGAAGPGGSGNGSFGGGGAGLCINITGTPVYYAGGGGAGSINGSVPGAGGIGGGGRGAYYASTIAALATPQIQAVAGAASTGGGGGGGAAVNAIGGSPGAAGGSGTVILRYVQTEDNLGLSGAVRFNTDFKSLEVYNSNYEAWSAQDQSRNFAGHNLLAFGNASNGTAQNCTRTLNTVPGPNGSFSLANTVTVTNVSNPGIFVGVGSVTANELYTFSIWVLAGTSNTFRLEQYQNGFGSPTFVSAGVLQGPATVLTQAATAEFTNLSTTVWSRVYVTCKMAVTGQSNPAIKPQRISGTTVGDSIHYYGAQVEFGQFIPGPTVNTTGIIAPAPGELGGYRVHRFTTVGTSYFTPACSGTVEVLVVAGGGGGGGDNGGGGGAGGVVYNRNYYVEAERTYKVVVGAGGAGSPAENVFGGNGGDSQFGNLIAVGGGGAGSGDPNTTHGKPGGSGGGAAGDIGASGSVPGAGVVGQGNPGGYYGVAGNTGGGGGGAGGPGLPGGNTNAGQGGPGIGINITGTLEYYAGGGGGGNENSVTGANGRAGGFGGVGGGGNGGFSRLSDSTMDGKANTGGGGGGSASSSGDYTGGNGGSGVVIVRYQV